MVMFIYFDIFLLLSVLFTCRTEAPSALTDVVEAKQYSERNKKETLTGVTLASFHGYIWTPPTSAGSISTVTAAKTQKLFFWSFSEQRAAVVCRGCGVTYLPYHKLPYRLKIGRGFFFQITFTNLTKSLLWCRNTIKKKKLKELRYVLFWGEPLLYHRPGQCLTVLMQSLYSCEMCCYILPWCLCWKNHVCYQWTLPGPTVLDLVGPPPPQETPVWFCHSANITEWLEARSYFVSPPLSHRICPQTYSIYFVSLFSNVFVKEKKRKRARERERESRDHCTVRLSLCWCPKMMFHLY